VASTNRNRKKTAALGGETQRSGKDVNKTDEQIVRVTMRRIRRGGFANVTMRQIADDLGVTATALYHHFEDKDELLDRVAGRIYDSIPEPDASAHWTERIRQLVLAQQRTLLDHPGLARFLLMHRMESTGAFRWIDSILKILREGGLHEQDIVYGLNLLTFLINPMTFLDAPQRRTVERTFSGSVSRRKVMQRADRFPNLVWMLDRLPDRSYEEQYARALDATIEALRARVEGYSPGAGNTASTST
jgi:AcrR family transcriptional regulator